MLEYLGKKIAHFLHDYHRDWFPRLDLPPTNGEHKQLIPFPARQEPFATIGKISRYNAGQTRDLRVFSTRDRTQGLR